MITLLLFFLESRRRPCFRTLWQCDQLGKSIELLVHRQHHQDRRRIPQSEGQHQ